MGGVQELGVQSLEGGWEGVRAEEDRRCVLRGVFGAEEKADGARAGFRLQHEPAIAVVEKWSRVRHPGLVSVREAFTTRAFGDHCTLFFLFALESH